LGIGDWGLGIGDWGLGPMPNPQSPIPHPQSPVLLYFFYILIMIKKYFKNLKFINSLFILILYETKNKKTFIIKNSNIIIIELLK